MLHEELRQERMDNNVGWAKIVVHFKGDNLIQTFQRNGFEVEGGDGFYTASYRRTE